MKKLLALFAASVILAACGGGGGGSTQSSAELLDDGGHCTGGTASIMYSDGDMEIAAQVFEDNLDNFSYDGGLKKALDVLHGNKFGAYILKVTETEQQADEYIANGWLLSVWLMNRSYRDAYGNPVWKYDHMLYVFDIRPDEFGGWVLDCVETSVNTFGMVRQFHVKDGVVKSGVYEGVFINMYYAYMAR